MRTRTYKIQFNAGREYQAGIDSSDHQVLMGYDGMDVVALFFNKVGRLGDMLVRPVGRFRNYKEQLAATEKVIKKWQAEMGFRPATIEIERFNIPDREIGIEDIPRHFLGGKDDPNNFPLVWESPQDYDDQLQSWISSGSFVLNWRNDFWIKKNGEFESS